ncbi:hypothetical protein SZ64_02770 [Erythrobacter sp. SG61-1L]|uniref:hypothetical protein n=1 Tax=Erythrobacter sp. SG61-1L TaxID=1603897 RepID=UPI0006C911DB|nr:hypothetical protein [Erythrobacter sp. SG61-1L]KPL67112.1 hypothetical protein SZ64_02770 [Erythrobacter sp. SG61-1L]
MKRLLPLLALPVLILPAVASAQQGAARFSIGEQMFRLPVPTGYCAPEGEMKQQTEQVADADVANITVGTWLACTGAGISQPVERYAIVRSSRRLSDDLYEKEPTLAEWEALYRRMAQSRANAQAMDEAEAAGEKALGQRTEMELADASLIERDGDCVYNGEAVGAGQPDATAQGMIMTCLTVRGQKIFTVTLYDFSGSGSLAPMKDRARAIALTIEPVTP